VVFALVLDANQVVFFLCFCPCQLQFFFVFFKELLCSSTLYIVVGMRVGLHLLANCEHVLVR